MKSSNKQTSKQASKQTNKQAKADKNKQLKQRHPGAYPAGTTASSDALKTTLKAGESDTPWMVWETTTVTGAEGKVG